MADNESSSKTEIKADPLLRKKYFIDAENVLTRKKPGAKRKTGGFSKIIDSSKVMISNKPVRLPLLRYVDDEDKDIEVDVIREGDKIKSIRITCPCGRSTELNCEYTTESKL